MKAYVEVLSGVIRSGPDCERYGDPFEYAVAFSCADGRHAVVKALTANGKLTLAHARAAFAQLRRLGLEPIWERFDPANDPTDPQPPAPQSMKAAA